MSEQKMKGAARNGAGNACIHCKHSMTTPEMAPQGLGRCIRYPPAAFPMQGQGGQMGAIAVWPSVRLNHDTCGEFLPGKIELASTMPALEFPVQKEP
ncbi:MAG: hypothetical protein WC683_07660 [bacterium]|jgi:hypothetical protein